MANLQTGLSLANQRALLEHHKACNCKNSRCLKLYCECFAAGRHCSACHCTNCFNNLEHNEERKAAVEAVLSRNPDAFRPKIQDAVVRRNTAEKHVYTCVSQHVSSSQARSIAGAPLARHNKGCNCKKSGCLKNYCECFQGGILCGQMCKCQSCKNYEVRSRSCVCIAHWYSATHASQGSAELQAIRASKAGRGAPGLVKVEDHSALPEPSPHRAALQTAVAGARHGHAPEDVAAALCSAALNHSGAGGEQGMDVC